MQQMVIFGAGGLGREVKSMLPYTLTKFKLIGFLDDNVAPNSVVDGVPVLGGLDWVEGHDEPVAIVVAIGDPRMKANVCQQLARFKYLHQPVLIHELAHLQDSDQIKIGEGSIICAGVVITTAVTIGKHVLINLNTTIGHDSHIGNFSSVMPGCNIAGSVTIGEQVLLGSGSNILNNIQVGDGATVGAGSVVNHEILSGKTAAGVPARVIKP